jgi:tripeptide aminopeptidase
MSQIVLVVCASINNIKVILQAPDKSNKEGITMPSPLASQLTQRFFRYLAITSQSDAAATTLPTTPGQFDMARALAQELQTLGLDEIVLDEHATVTAVKKGTVPGAPRIGFITHIDTVDVGLSPDIHPQILRFQGKISV